MRITNYVECRQSISKLKEGKKEKKRANRHTQSYYKNEKSRHRERERMIETFRSKRVRVHCWSLLYIENVCTKKKQDS